MKTSKAIATLCALFESIRPASTLIGAVGASLSLLATAPGSSIGAHLMIFAIVGLAMGGGFLFNDFFDEAKDRINEPTRPLPAGRIGKSAVVVAGTVCLLGSVALALPMGFMPSLLVIVNVALLFAYSWIRVWHGVAGNLVTAYFAASVIVLGGLVGTWHVELLPAMCFVFGIILLREFIFDIHDYPGDQVVGLRTLATLLGRGRVFGIVYSGGIVLAIFLSISALAGWVSHPALFLPLTLISLAMTILPLRRYQLSGLKAESYRRFYLSSKIGLFVAMPGLVAGVLG